MKAYEEDRRLKDAIVDLVIEMSRVQPVLFTEGAYDVIRQIVHELLRDAGKGRCTKNRGRTLEVVGCF